MYYNPFVIYLTSLQLLYMTRITATITQDIPDCWMDTLLEASATAPPSIPGISASVDTSTTLLTTDVQGITSATVTQPCLTTSSTIFPLLQLCHRPFHQLLEPWKHIS